MTQTNHRFYNWVAASECPKALDWELRSEGVDPMPDYASYPNPILQKNQYGNLCKLQLT